LAKDEHFWQLPLENVVGARKEVLDVLFIFPGQTDLISSLFFQTRSSHLHFLALLGGVAQVAKHLLSRHRPQVQTPVPPPKHKNGTIISITVYPGFIHLQLIPSLPPDST
jgi:hypothetical protein